VKSLATGTSDGGCGRRPTVRLASSSDAERWANLIERGLVRITTVTRLEVGYSARSADDLRHGLSDPPVASMPVEYASPAIEDRAVAVQASLADRGHHRAPSIPDLLSPPRRSWLTCASPTSTRTSI